MTDTVAFVHTHTRLAPALFVPEVLLHQADEAIPLWELTEGATSSTQPPPFWAFAWAGGQALARHILDHPEIVAGARVLDLAAGSGLVGIAAARAGAARVTAAEIDPFAIAAIHANATANNVEIIPVLTDLLAEETGPDVDVVLAGDVFYSREMAGRMLAYLRLAVRSGAVALAGDPGRAYLPTRGLRLVATYDVPVVTDLEDRAVKPTTVWAVA